MGNQNNSGVLLFTVYQNGQPARFWPCYLVEQVTAAFSGKANSIAMFSPLGSGTEANVFVSDLSVTAAYEGVGGIHTVHVRFTFAGSAQVDALLPVRLTIRGEGGAAAVTGHGPYGWSGAFTGPDGQPVALMVEFTGAHLEQPYGQPMAQGSRATAH